MSGYSLETYLPKIVTHAEFEQLTDIEKAVQADYHMKAAWCLLRPLAHGAESRSVELLALRNALYLGAAPFERIDQESWKASLTEL